jgi:tetratricopeptide (TPR) repeat protein
MDKHTERALVLIEQSRYDLAERELRQALAGSPDDPYPHTLLAMCLCERQQYAEATEEARTAIRLDPEVPRSHHVLARILLERHRPDEALPAIREALRLAPDRPDHYALLAAIRLDLRDWQGALEAAEKGLQADAEHAGCTNLRAMALMRLGRRDEAGAALAGTLARDPEDAWSHANQGWVFLQGGQRRKALEHFREALRLQPGLDYARAGMVEALKSKNLIYALLLRYFLFMARLSRGAQWGIVVGGYVVYRLLGEWAGQNPEVKPWVTPLLIAYVVFAVLTWIAGPVFNLLLRLDRFGRHALSAEQVSASNWVGALLGLALLSLGVWLFSRDLVEFLALLAALYFGLLLLPLSAVFNCQRGWPRRTMTLYTLGLAAVGLSVFVLLFLGSSLTRGALQAFTLGSFLSGFVANFLMQSVARR